MSVPQLPFHLVSLIVGLANDSFNEKDAVVVQIDADTGHQLAESNPLLVARLTDSVIAATKVLRQHRRFFKLAFRELSEFEGEEDGEDGEEDAEEMIVAIEAIAAADPSLDEVIIKAAHGFFALRYDAEFSCEIFDKAFYTAAFDIANQLSALSLRMRRQYLTKVIETIHKENPELDLAMHDFITYYTQDYPLINLVSTNLPAWAIVELDADKEDYEPIEAHDSDDSLNIFKWANRCEKNRKKWLSVVNGQQWEKRNAPIRSLFFELRELYRECRFQKIMEMTLSMVAHRKKMFGY
jgi:hypothetical protein